MSARSDQLVRAFRSLSPASRRWRRFLQALPLDPDRLPSPLSEPSDRDFIICGSPRTGTSFMSAALFRPPEIITVMEPWDGMRLAPAALFSSLREEIAGGTLERGRLDLESLAEDGTVRWQTDGASRRSMRVSSDFLLGVKWPTFWRYLGLLPTTRFIVCLRDPIEVINSYKRVGGRVGLGLDYDTAFNAAMNRSLSRATKDPALRRIMLFDYIHERIIPYLTGPNVLAVQYERWFSDADAVLREVGDFLGCRLDGSPSPALVRRPSAIALDEGEIELIRTHCRTAEALGYDLTQKADRAASPS